MTFNNRTTVLRKVINYIFNIRLLCCCCIAMSVSVDCLSASCFKMLSTMLMNEKPVKPFSPQQPPLILTMCDRSSRLSVNNNADHDFDKASPNNEEVVLCVKGKTG